MTTTGTETAAEVAAAIAEPVAAVAATEAAPAQPHVVRAPAKTARRIALVLSVLAVVTTFFAGFSIRKVIANVENDAALPWTFAAMCLLLGALVLRMFAAVCEILWLERTWSNLPEELRKVGPVEKPNTGLVIGLNFVPGVAWVWKLGLVMGIADGFEAVRRDHVPFETRIPKKLGMAAVIVGWVPGLNVYIAPFLWEIFAIRIDSACNEILAKRGG